MLTESSKVLHVHATNVGYDRRERETGTERGMFPEDEEESVWGGLER